MNPGSQFQIKEGWQAVIGLEIHAELNTKTKLFSSAPNRFGDEPNVNITSVCTGQPGALPVLNREAVKKAVQFGCAINAEVCNYSKFDRKSYFYPDSPRNFQITQFEHPIVKGGQVIAEVDGVEKEFFIDRAHLEDDAGTLKHFNNFVGIDFNRAGCPLIEIVSKPCIHSPAEAVAYAKALKSILEYIDVSDCNMEEGSLRIDVNVSVRPIGEPLRNKIEIKNMNSFSYMEKAISKEIARQIELYTSRPSEDPNLVVEPSTFRWDLETKDIILMRKKESADDYRYFPEPDLVPIVLDVGYIENIKQNLCELPLQRERRYVKDFSLSTDQAFAIASSRSLADFFELAQVNCLNAKNLANWILVEFAGKLKDSDQDILTIGILPQNICQLINLIEQGTVTGKIAKAVADEMIKHPHKLPQDIVAENPDFQPMTDSTAIEAIVDEVIAANPDSIATYLSGRDRALAFLVGQVMKKSSGKASPKIVNELLLQKINKK